MPACRSCNADIEWAKWIGTGKNVPINVGATKDGNLVVISGRVRSYTDEDARLHRERRVSHFTTCPQADSWRSG